MEKPDRIMPIHIAATPQQIWDLLHDSAASSDWFFGRRMRVGSNVGAPFSVTTADANVEVRGEVLASEPPRRLEVSWDVGMAGFPPIRVEFLIEPLGAVSRFTVSEYYDGFQPPEAAVKSGREGWSLILSGIKTILETGAPLPPATRRVP